MCGLLSFMQYTPIGINEDEIIAERGILGVSTFFFEDWSGKFLFLSRGHLTTLPKSTN